MRILRSMLRAAHFGLKVPQLRRLVIKQKAVELALVKLALEFLLRCLLKCNRVYVLRRTHEFPLPQRRKFNCLVIAAYRADVAKVIEMAHRVLGELHF